MPICFYDELGCTRIVGMNWDFVAIFFYFKIGNKSPSVGPHRGKMSVRPSVPKILIDCREDSALVENVGN